MAKSAAYCNLGPKTREKYILIFNKKKNVKATMVRAAAAGAMAAGDEQLIANATRARAAASGAMTASYEQLISSKHKKR